MKKKCVTGLLDLPESWEEHWKGMPEFIQGGLIPWRSIYVHFENESDMLVLK